MKRFAITTFALAIGLMAAPQLRAQTPAWVQVCRDGTVIRSNNSSACILHGGLDQQATNQSSRGIYGTNGTAGNRGVYNGGSVNGSDRGIYNGGNRSTIYDRTGTQSSDHRSDRARARQQERERERWIREHRKDDRRGEAHRDQDRDRDHKSDRYRANDDRR
jgi:hypothetical protein